MSPPILSIDSYFRALYRYSFDSGHVVSYKADLSSAERWGDHRLFSQ